MPQTPDMNTHNATKNREAFRNQTRPEMVRVARIPVTRGRDGDRVTDKRIIVTCILCSEAVPFEGRTLPKAEAVAGEHLTVKHPECVGGVDNSTQE